MTTHPPLPDIRQVRDAAITWLTESRIRASDGAYRSIYKPDVRAYENFNRGDTCLLVTSGATMLLDDLGYPDLALQSAEHILSLVIDGGHARGALPVGRGGRLCVPSYIMFAVQAMLRMHAKTGDERFLKAAAGAGDFVVDKMQLRDGSLVGVYPLQRRYALGARYLMPRSIWQGICIEGLLDLHEITGEARYLSAAQRLGEWLGRQQLHDGSFPLNFHTVPSGLYALLRNRNLRSVLNARQTRHPAANTYAIQVLLKLGKVDAARRSAQWMHEGLGPNGLLYQYYYEGGRRSVEEDVMPTAHFALLAVDNPALGLDEGLADIVARGIAYAQIHSDDPDANGAMRGLPLHVTRSEQAYTWDTIFSIRFLHRVLEGPRGGEHVAGKGESR